MEDRLGGQSKYNEEMRENHRKGLDKCHRGHQAFLRVGRVTDESLNIIHCFQPDIWFCHDYLSWVLVSLSFFCEYSHVIHLV